MPFHKVLLKKKTVNKNSLTQEKMKREQILRKTNRNNITVTMQCDSYNFH